MHKEFCWILNQLWSVDDGAHIFYVHNKIRLKKVVIFYLTLTSISSPLTWFILDILMSFFYTTAASHLIIVIGFDYNILPANWTKATLSKGMLY